MPQKYRKKQVETTIEAVRRTGRNLGELWDRFGTAGIYGPTEKNSTALLLTTIDGVQVPCPLGHWVMPERILGRFYPCDPGVFAERYEAIPE